MVEEKEEERKKRLWEEAARHGIPPLRDLGDLNEEKYLRWLGGFFDGEGCVSIPEMKKLAGYPFDYTLKVEIGGNFKEVLEEIQQRFEGNLYPTGDSEYSWRLNWSADKALRFLKAIRPYVRLKWEEVEDGIRFQQDKVKLLRGTVEHAILDEMKRRERLSHRLHYLNRVRNVGRRVDED